MRPRSPVTSWAWAKAWGESLLAGPGLTHTLASAQQGPAKATQPGPEASAWPPWGATEARGQQGCPASLCKDSLSLLHPVLVALGKTRDMAVGQNFCPLFQR